MLDPQRPAPVIPEGPEAPRAEPPAERPGERGRLPLTRPRAVFEVLVCSGVPTQTFFAGLLALVGIPPQTGGGRLNPEYFISLGLIDTVAILALVTYFLRRQGDTLGGLLRGRRRIGPEVGLGLLLVPVILFGVALLLLAIRTFAPVLRNVPVNPLEGLISTPAGAALFGLTAIVAGGVREEVQRAFLLTRFSQRLGGPWVGLVILSVAFGAGHYIQGWDAAIATGALGAFWAWLYIIRGSAVAAIVSHAGFNALEVLQQAVLNLGE